jgi:GNAT superfamily N-acetyltransferase
VRAARTTARTDAAIAWQHSCQALIVDSVEPWSHGSVLRTPLAPDWWDANLVRLEGPDPGLSADELIALVDGLQADLQHRRLVVEDEAAGLRLRDGFADAGWETERLVMLLRAGPAPEAPEDVVEAPYADTRALRLEWHHSSDWGDEEALHLDSADAVAARIGTRAFVARGDDGRLRGFCSLLSGADGAEVDQAYVTPAARGHGLGARLISAALAAGGHHTNWIVADDEGRPKGLYQRLGFEPAWRWHTFTRLPPS